ncbi:unnamed protein product [Calicophoron daubneyi]|uniref:K Homology domain-containing protein n=1 Tax=Calicophoron daubneyi TaxID=300641 RepID=A0AAV2TNK6_CALDB
MVFVPVSRIGMQGCLMAQGEQSSSSGTAEDQDFPALVKASGRHCETKFQNSPLPAYHPAKVTEFLEIPREQRRFQSEDAQALGGSRICAEITKETGVEITTTNSKSHMLKFVLCGHPKNVALAKRRIIAELQQQESVKMTVPQEYHGYLIGRRGDRLRDLQAKTMTRISIPPSNSPDPSIITITGPKQGVADAQQMVLDIIQRQSEQGFERLDIPKIYHPFICGPNNQTLDDLKRQTDVKINVPPPGSAATVITVSGKREGVEQAVSEIQAIYEEAKLSKTIPVRVKKSQHRLVFGPRGSGLSEILAATGVSVELPTDPTSEEITLRGRPEDLGRALSMVFERAESSVTEEILAPHRFHKILIGKKGSAVAELLEGYERVRLEFGENQDKILVEGPPEEVTTVVKRLKDRLVELEATVAMDTIRVDPKYFRHIIGRQGANVLRWRENRVQIRLPKLERGDNLAADEVVIEGDPAGVEKTKAEIRHLIEKLENEKCKDVIIEPRIQQLLCTGCKGHAPPIRTIYENFPKVSILWPESGPDDTDSADSPAKSVVQLRGDRQQVDAAAERLHKLIKQVVEENYRQEIRIFREFRPQIFGRGSSKIQKLLDETNTRLQYPNPSEDSDVFTIIGREENVQKAIQQLEELQKNLANVKEVVVSIPSELTTKFVGDQAPSIRSILEQCDGVHMRLLNPRQKNSRKSNQSEIVMIGLPAALEKAQKLVDQLNARVAQLCAEELVHVNPRFHGFLIGRQGSNITRFRERHNVELLFPDRMETDPKLATEIRIVGPKDAVASAKSDLEAMIKTIEDEVDFTVMVDPNRLREIAIYRRSFPNPHLDRVRVIMPRGLNRPVEDESNTEEETVPIKLIGQKACMEAAVQSLQSIIKDIEEEATKEFPLTDPNQFLALDRLRSQFRDMERNHRVFINLRRSVENEAAQESLEHVIDALPPTVYSPSGTLVITGRPEQIDQVFEEEIKPLLPVEEEYPMAQEFHRGLIFVPSERSRRGPPTSRGRQVPTASETNEDSAVPANETQSKAAELKQKYNVVVRLPQSAANADYVLLRGTPAQLANARAELDEWVKHSEELKMDRIARSYEECVYVPTRFIQSIIALRSKLVANRDISMRFGADVPAVPTPNNENAPEHAETQENGPVGTPEEDESRQPNGTLNQNTVAETGTSYSQHPELREPHEKMTTIIFRGYKERIAEAKNELDEAVKKLMSQITESLYIPAEVHPRLIGSRGNAIHRVMQEFNVRIEFPGRNVKDKDEANTVLVTGDESDVDRACDYLIARANDFMERMDGDSRTTKPTQFREELLPSNGPSLTGP